MNRVDRWWNRYFPPFSVARLVFFWVMLPIFALPAVKLTGPGSGDGYNWPTYWLTVVAGELMVTLGWILARLRQDELATWKTPTRRLFGIPLPALPEPPARVAANRVARSSLTPHRGGIDPFLDFVLSTVALHAGFSLMLGIGGFEGAGSARQLFFNLIGALLVALSLVFRYSILPVILLSVVVGAGGAIFLAMMSMFLSDTPFWQYWIVSSLMAFTCLVPYWIRLRSSGPLFERLRLPSCVTATATAVLMVLAASTVGGTEMAPADRDQIATELPPHDSALGAPLGSASPEIASAELLGRWAANNRADALRFARHNAVSELFALPFHPSARFVGCGTVFGGYERCVIQTDANKILLEWEMADRHSIGSNYVIRGVDVKPADYEVALTS